MKTLFVTLTLLVGLFGISSAEEEWIPLFDGSNLEAWRGYQQEGIPKGWSIQEDGTLLGDGKSNIDLITKEQFENFEIVIEWKIEARGNSGILIRVDETPAKIWHHAPEIQIFDAKEGDENLGHHAGALYALAPAKPEAIKAPGNWNETRIKILNNVITITHNGIEIVTIEAGSEEWHEKVAASKFAKFPQFGTNPKGHIGLQDHGHPTWFRSIQLRKL